MRRGLRFPKWAARSKRGGSKSSQRVFGLLAHHRRLLFESLEGRVLLTSVVVNMATDVSYAQGSGLVSLRNAIATANTSTSPTTITFDPTAFASAQAIALGSNLVLSNVSQPTTVTGPAAGATLTGYGLQIQAGTVATFSNINVSGAANGIENFGNVTVNGAAILGTNLGGVSNSGTATLNNVIISGGQPGDWGLGGGGVRNTGTVAMTNCTVSNNITDYVNNGGGGGIYNSGTATLTNVTVSGNTGSAAYNTQGGGICNTGIATLTDVTVSGNAAGNASHASYGGGIYNDGTLTLTNVTVSNNVATGGTASTDPGGGGIYNDTAGTVILADATISGNSVPGGSGTGSGGGGISNLAVPGSFTLANSIVAGNTATNLGPDAYGNFASLGHNLVGKTDNSSGWKGTDLTGTIASPLAPGLGPLADNGGPTQTMALLLGSPAIGKGSVGLIPSGITTDQRGLPRVVSGIVDIGAYQSQPPVVTGISPAAGPLGGGTTVTITGAGLNGATAVDFGGVAAAIASNTATQIVVTSPAGLAGTVDVIVISPNGTSAATSADQFTYMAVPAVTSVSPAAGPAAGGTTVTIVGTDLAGATAVTFGGAPATIINDTATQITATSPAGSVGAVDVSVVTPGGTSATSASDQFTYLPAPSVTGINPGSGPAKGGTTVTIAGANLAGATAVWFGGTAASITSDTDNQIVVASPAESAGTVDVTVIAAGGASATSPADLFTFVAAPAVTGVSPAAGPLAGGTRVTITGTSLAGATAVKFGGIPATINGDTATQIVATSPAGAAGIVDVTVVTPNGTSAASPSDQFAYLAAPAVTGVSPTAGPLAGGISVTITGTNLAGAAAVDFGGTAALITKDTATQITVTSPAGTAGPVDVTVVTPGGTSAMSSSDLFTYAAPPAVTAIAPSAGLATGGTSVTITGTNLAGAVSVKFGSAAATITGDTATQITATSPTGTGRVDVTVTTAGGTSTTSAADQFSFVPVVTAVTLAQGPASGGTTVTITGAGLAQATAVNFGSVAATIVNDTATQIVVTTPAQLAGPVDVTVVTAGGTSDTSPASQFTYLAAPIVTGLDPDSGLATGGDSVTITGTDLAGATAVMFGSAAATITSDTATQITATSPAGTGMVDVTVTTAGGTSPTSAADQFSYVPVVTGISPAQGPGAGGTTVTITGAGLDAATGVTFGNHAATVTSDTGTQITATSPAGALGTVDVTVTTPGGTSAASTSDQFTYVAPYLAITNNHVGNFTQEDAGDTYTIAVTNSGTAATAGLVSVTGALPTGLTATAMSGDGWTVDLATLTATRSDALAVGASYPSLSVTVSVAANAPASVTSVAKVTGGGEPNTSNQTASDPTTINPLWTVSNVSGKDVKSGTTGFSFVVTRAVAGTQTINLGYATADGTAIAGHDYLPGSGNMVFSPGELQQTIAVAVKGSKLYEGDKTFFLNVTDPAGATGSGTGTIQNANLPPAVSIGNVSLKEGNSGTTKFNFVVSLSAASGAPATVVYATADGTATVADNDYQAKSGTISFAPGQTKQTVTVAVSGDTKYEANEAFSVHLSNPVGATIAKGKGVGTGTILNDDKPSVLAIGNVTVAESAGGGNVVFTVTLSPASGLAATVKYATASGTAKAGKDFKTTSGVLTFAAGQTTQTITVPILSDPSLASAATFLVKLSGASHATLGTKSAGTCTIQQQQLPSLLDALAAAQASAAQAKSRPIGPAVDEAIRLMLTSGR